MVGFATLFAWHAHRLEGHFFQPIFLALVHFAVLLWLLPIAFGALLQMVPVIFSVDLPSRWMPWTAFVLYLLGSSGLIGHMWDYATGWGLPAAAGLLAASIWLYAITLFLAIGRSPKVDLTGAHVIFALLFLMLSSALGVALAWNLYRPFLLVDHLMALRAHVHLAGMGFFGLLIFGVAYKLCSMFLLAYGAKTWAGWLSLLATSTGLILLGVDWIFGVTAELQLFAASALALGVLAFFQQILAIFRTRLKKDLEVPWWHTLASFGWLALASAFGLWLLRGDAEVKPADWEPLAYALAGLLGFVGSIVVGQLYKILPFLIWLHRFSPRLGEKPLPTAAQLIPQDPQVLQWSTMQIGLLWLLAGLALQIPAAVLVGCGLFAVSAWMFAALLLPLYFAKP